MLRLKFEVFIFDSNSAQTQLKLNSNSTQTQLKLNSNSAQTKQLFENFQLTVKKNKKDRKPLRKAISGKTDFAIEIDNRN